MSVVDDVTVLGLDDREQWIDAHRDGGLPCQSWHYAWALAASGLRSKLAVVRAGGARMLLPFFEREWQGTTDIATVLGLSGTSISPPSPAPPRLWREFAAAQGWVAGYIQLAVGTELAARAVDGEIVEGNAVFLLDLRADTLASASINIRLKVQLAKERGALVYQDADRLAEALRRLYPATMRRVGAARQYELSTETLERLARDPDTMLVGGGFGTDVDTVHVFRIAGEHAEYHMVGTTERGRDLAALMICEGAARLQQSGVRLLNLGGGVKPGDGLHSFKRRFNGAPKPLRSLRQVYDRARYDELCRRAGVDPTGGAWFPAYRTLGSRQPG